ncbi:hypothetical protein [Butyrivibrio sp. LB2008]|uniref:hypothetical protein n=1 Tax=Butyrivibrio sp. LB2008 TaxID=1408305 RepID=UPI000479F37A|nr:hypothetical protein [Butyrivibrio sp. LB2008]
MNRQIIFRYYILLTMFVIGAVVSVIWAIRYTKNPSQRSPYSALMWVAVIEKTLIYGIPILFLFYAIRFASDLPYVIKGDYITKTGAITENGKGAIRIDGKWYTLLQDCGYSEGCSVTIKYLPHTKFSEICH